MSRASLVLLGGSFCHHCPFTAHSASLAAEPGILSVRLGDESNLSGHFHVVNAPAVLKVLPLSLPAGLLEVASALHRVDDPVLG